MRVYVVKQGDYLEKIARRFGVKPDVVWNHPLNGSLRARRVENILFPGDVLTLPDPRPTPTEIVVGRCNPYQAEAPHALVRLKIKHYDETLRGVECTVDGLGISRKLTTDESGMLTIEVPLHVETVLVACDKPPMKLRIRVGHLDPVDTESGALQRLINLGYATEQPSGAVRNILQWVHGPTATEVQLKAALRAFQEHHELVPSGILDDLTRAKLAALHGC